jgi:hypothetical protein
MESILSEFGLRYTGCTNHHHATVRPMTRKQKTVSWKQDAEAYNHASIRHEASRSRLTKEETVRESKHIGSASSCWMVRFGLD